jgi:hypothetical protein
MEGGFLSKLLRVTQGQLIVTTMGATGTMISALFLYSKTVPLPVVYPRWEIRGGERDPPKDPKAVFKLINAGGSPMVIDGLQIFASGKSVATFGDALGKLKFSSFSSESTNFLGSGHKGRYFSKHAGIVLGTARPVGDYIEGTTWVDEIQDALKTGQVKVVTSYSYFHVPFFGPVLKTQHTSTLGRNDEIMTNPICAS